MPGRLRRRKQVIRTWGSQEGLEPPREPPRRWGDDLGDPAGLGGLTQSADGAVVGLVAQGVGTAVTQAEVATGQDQGVPHVGEAHHALSAVVAHLVLSHLAGRRVSQCHRDPHDPRFVSVFIRSFYVDQF